MGVRQPARTFHEELTGTTFINFGPTVLTLLQDEVYSKGQLLFAQVLIGSAHRIRSTPEFR